MSTYDQHEEIHTEEQAVNWMVALITTVETYRKTVDVMIPDVTSIEAADQKSMYRKLLMHYGIATGALTALVHCRKLSEAAHAKMKQQLLQAMVPKIVGDAGRIIGV